MTMLTGPRAGIAVTMTAPAPEEIERPPANAGADARPQSRTDTADRFESAQTMSQVRTRITVDGSSDRMVVQIVDAITEETIREIPPEKLRELANYLAQFLGLRMDERA